MDVRCERCSTEYEFDDALVSGRGTTVKCTNCGHKFKIRRSDGDFSEDFWNVQTGDGRTLVFTSLRELQRAIQTNLVDRHDLLSRGGLKQKPIGQIPELAPFFEQRDQRRSVPPPAVAAPAPAPRAGDGATSGAASASHARSSRPPPPPGASAPPLVAPPRQRMATRPDFPPAPPPAAAARPSPPPPPPSPVPPAPPPPPPADRTSDRPRHLGSMNKTLLGTGSFEDGSGHEPSAAPQPSEVPIPAAPAMRQRLARPRPSENPPSTEREIEPDTERFARGQMPPVATPPPVPRGTLAHTQPIDPVFLPKHTPAPPPFEASSPLPPPTPPALRSMHVDPDEYSDGVRGRSLLSDAPPSMGRRRSVGGYIVAFAVVAGVVLIGAVWAKDHLRGLLGGRQTPVAVADPRVEGLLAAGEKSLTEGSLEAAKESFDKASALAEKEPRVLLDLARLAALRADVPWLKSRLLASDAADEHRLTKADLDERAAVARKAADDALAVAPDDLAAVRTKIDALRISGDRDAARALVGRVTSSASQPETAYVLAALDLADSEPLWSTVLERLRVAASAESGPGRARAALAYALARSGDVSGAKAEVERLAAMSRPHVLLPLLRGFAARATPAAPQDAGAPVAAGSALADAGRVRGDRDRGDRGDRGDPGGGKPTGDARQLVAQGEAARAKGDYDRAQMHFAAALDRNPNDTEALNGLAAIAHARRDLNGARASYKRVLSINPSYVPALVGVGDVDWESGDRASAMKTYKEIVDRFPEGTYPARVKQRVSAPAAAPGTSSAATPSSTATAPAPAPSDTGGGG